MTEETDEPTLDQTRGASRARRARWIVVGALIASTSITQSAPTRALGPVTAVTPYGVIDNGYVGYVFNPQVSGRGEAVVIYDHEVRETSFVFMDNAAAEPMVYGLGTAVSGNGCVALWVRPSGSSQLDDANSIGITDRCRGVEREVLRTNAFYDDSAQIALSFDGRFAAVQLPPSVGSEFEPNHLVRVDTETGEIIELPPPVGYYGAHADMGIDISDDGNAVAVPFRSNQDGRLETVVWWVPTNALEIIASPTFDGFYGSSVFPSMSGDSRYIAFTSGTPLTGTESGIGPWVYVRDRATGAMVRVSGAAGSAYYSSISGDGTQVAFGVAATGGCSYTTITTEGDLTQECPTDRVDVAFGPAPGLNSGFTVETISRDVNNRIAGYHAEPNLSWSGRWVTWVSTAGNALLGSNDSALQNRHAYLRERDGGLTVDAISFGSLLAGTSATGTSTVRNVGRTSVFLDTLSVTPSRFAIVGGGTCSVGLVLAPGTACTVNVRFSAPTAAGDTAGTITVGETGFRPIVATNDLTGRSTITPPAPTTTVRGQVPPGPTTTTTTTVPGSVTLDVTPNPVDFGPVAVGIGSPIQTITVTNTGTADASLVTSLGGTNPEDFFVSQNGCNAIVLRAGQSCAIDVIMVATAGGIRTAVLTVAVPSVGSEDVALSGDGRFSPRLLASPSAITERGFTTIVGQGFPPGGSFTVYLGDTGDVIPVTADATGVFRIPYSAFGKLTLGDYVLRVDAQANVFELVQTQLVVVLPTFEPQGPGGAVFGTSVLVTRGG